MSLYKWEGYESIADAAPEKLILETEKTVKRLSLLDIADEKIEDIQNCKAIQIGYPLGGIFEPQKLEQKPLGEVFDLYGFHPAGESVVVIREADCSVDYLRKLISVLNENSCGRCVFCREGLRQLKCIFDDIAKAKFRPGDAELIKTIADAMVGGSHCIFGKSAGALFLNLPDSIQDEIRQHQERHRCPSSVCEGYITYHILPDKCTGCGDCLEMCTQDAIEGENGYVHVISQFECVKCGKCTDACGEGAIIKAGAVKPKTPDEPIPVGSW